MTKNKQLFAKQPQASFFSLFKTALCALVLLAATLAVSLMAWARSTWEDLEFEQILSNINILPRSLDILTFSPEMKYYLIAGAVLFLFLIAVCSNKRLLQCAFALLLVFVWQIRIIPYYYYHNTTTKLYENYYRAPEITAADFPQQKRNLILLHLESVENNFADKNLYGANLLPELSALAAENPSFTGYQALYGTNYTKAALVAGHCGIAYRTPALSFGNIYTHLANITCLSDILAANGYETWFAKSADHTFAYTDIFYNQHKYQHIIDRYALTQGLSDEEINKNKSSYDGLSDKLLFTHILNLFQQQKIKEPFLLTAFTVDTHVPGTVLPYNCPKVYGDVRDNILCSDSTVADFIKEFQKTPYWQNTTVVIVGDHPMFKELKPQKRQKHRRGIFNVFLNLPQKPVYTPDKPFTALDMPATYMEALGINLKGHAFGLGRSLFSDVPSLISLPEAKLKNAVKQYSALYETFSKTPVNSYNPYKLGTILTQELIPNYTNYYKELFDHIFINMLSFKLDSVPEKDLTLSVTLNAMLSYKPKLYININGEPLTSVKLQKKIGEQSITVDIPAERITSPKLSIEFINNNYRSVISQGIDIRKFVLR